MNKRALRSEWLSVPLRQIVLWAIAILTVLFVFRFTSAQVAQPANAAAKWISDLGSEISTLDARTDGTLGIYVKKFGQGEYRYNADRPWYLASTVKVPIAVVLLQEIEAGRLDLSKKLVLKESDYVDGSGDLRHKKHGTRLSVKLLLQKMLVESDSTATDMLIRYIGADRLNKKVKLLIPDAGDFTTLLAVRHLGFSELHPQASQLSNIDFINLKVIPESEKINWLSRKMKVPTSEFSVLSIDDAFESFYLSGKNSSSLSAYGAFLENLATGKLLKPAQTNMLLSLMEQMKTGDKRIKAGLPVGMKFAQKTGTQIRRLCNVGIVREVNVVISVCLEKFSEREDGENTLRLVGETLVRSGVFSRSSRQAAL